MKNGMFVLKPLGSTHQVDGTLIQEQQATWQAIRKELWIEIDLKRRDKIFLADGEVITMQGVGYGLLSCNAELKGTHNIII